MEMVCKKIPVVYWRIDTLVTENLKSVQDGRYMCKLAPMHHSIIAFMPMFFRNSYHVRQSESIKGMLLPIKGAVKIIDNSVATSQRLLLTFYGY